MTHRGQSAGVHEPAGQGQHEAGGAGGASTAGGASCPWPARLLVVYPPGWRTRYGDELDQLIRDLRASGRNPVPMALDLLRGAAAAWLTERRSHMSERSRGALLTVLWSWVAFAATAAWFGHDLPNYPIPSVASQVAITHPAVPDAYNVLLGAGIVGVGATAVAAVVFGIGAVRYAHANGRRRTYLLMAVPPVVATLWLAGSAGFPHQSNSVVAWWASVLWLLLGVAGIAGSTQAVSVIVRTSEFSAWTWRIGGTTAAVVTAAMLVATGATVAWGIAFRTSQANLGDASGWLVVTVIMAVTTARAVIALIGSRHSVAKPSAAA